MIARANRQLQGFTVLELLVSMGIFMVICAAMFELLELSQKRYTSESQLSGAFQESRLAVDQIVRDFDVSGYPAKSMFSTLPSDSTKYAYSPVAWYPGNPTTTCLVGTAGSGTCTTPGDFDLILETDLGTGTGVNWIRYQLIGTTLFRSVVPKVGGNDQAATVTSAAGVMVPFLTNVMNTAPNTHPELMSQIKASYPSMFLGGNSQPIFQYTCDTPIGPAPCPTAGNSATPANIRDVDINLIVMTPQRDMQTQAIKLVQLTGRGQRVNPAN